MSSVDPFYKKVLRFGWRHAQTVLACLPWRERGIAVWYGGARPGNIGGPLVKVQRLQRFFPRHLVGYSIVYLLSNTPYLSRLALQILKWRKVPVVLNQNGVYYGAWYDGDWQAKNREMAMAWQHADYVFCQSSFCRDCAEQFLGPRKGPVEILHNAVDLNHFRPLHDATLREKAVFLLTGKIDDHMFYRVDITMRGFAAARQQGMEARLQLSGWMSEGARNRSEALAITLGIQDDVTLTGAYTQEEAPDIYRSADVYVMLKHNDPCPNTVLEALACGLPVLYSNSGGVPELATGMAGLPLKVEQGFDKNHVPEPSEIAQGMQSILMNFPERRQAARTRAEQAFDLDHWIDHHRTIFNTLNRR